MGAIDRNSRRGAGFWNEAPEIPWSTDGGDAGDFCNTKIPWEGE